MKNVLPLLWLALAGIATPALAQTAQGDAAAGQKKAAMCVGCHSIPGYQASFPEVHKVPMIAGQGAKYLENALVAYQKGERKHPTMKAIAVSLSSQDMADLAAYFAALSPAPAQKVATTAKPSALAEQLLKAGNCAACHGQDYASPIDPSYPKLAGQHADYLFVAARSYMVEGSAIRGRSHPVMSGAIKAAAATVGEREFLAQLKEAAAYMAALPSNLATVPEGGWR